MEDTQEINYTTSKCMQIQNTLWKSQGLHSQQYHTPHFSPLQSAIFFHLLSFHVHTFLKKSLKNNEYP